MIRKIVLLSLISFAIVGITISAIQIFELDKSRKQTVENFNSEIDKIIKKYPNTNISTMFEFRNNLEIKINKLYAQLGETYDTIFVISIFGLGFFLTKLEDFSNQKD